MTVQEKLKAEAERAAEMLRGKVVARARRHRRNEIGIEFNDGARLFVDRNSAGLEISITDGANDSVTEEG